MGQELIRIEPYRPDLEPEILAIENTAIRGSLINMEIVRDSYIRRAQVFQSYGSYLGFNEKGKLVGAIIGTKVPLKINGKEFKAGFGLDLQVLPAWNNKDTGRHLTDYLVRNFFYQHNLTKNFITLKVSHNPVMKLGESMFKKYTFVNLNCLVIPTRTRITGKLTIEKSVSFSIDLMDQHYKFPELISSFKGGLSAWHSHKLYKLRISKIHPLARIATAIVSLLSKKKYPSNGDEIKTATLFNLNRENIVHINDALDYLEKNEVNYINVACQKNDPVYTLLKTYSIFTYDNYIVADFPLRPNDKITLDVRCL
jgi:hypothetical protein